MAYIQIFTLRFNFWDYCFKNLFFLIDNFGLRDDFKLRKTELSSPNPLKQEIGPDDI